jgi:spore coat polysaccharide biosynthesis protein SpsF (cytidylyltransferase family)
MKKVVIVVQARMGSTRLPGKILKIINGKSLLFYEFDRLKKIKHEVTFLLATTVNEIDNPLEKFAQENDLEFFQGSEEDVLDRFYQGCRRLNADIVVRITGDCPLIDPSVIDDALDLILANNYDYVSNVHPATYPDGLDVEVFPFSVLEKMWREATLKSEREHVTPYIYTHPDLFTMHNFEYKVDLSKYRLTVDEIEDFKLISHIITHFAESWNDFTVDDVIKLIDSDENLFSLNAGFERNEGYEKSLKEDKIE